MLTIEKAGAEHVHTAHTDSVRVRASGFAGICLTCMRNQLIDKLQSSYSISARMRSIPKEPKKVEEQIRTTDRANATFAPDAVNRMLSDAEYRERMEQKLADMVGRRDALREEFLRMGSEYVDSGMVVHDDGSVTNWILFDQSFPPEEAEQAQAAREEEANELAEEHRRYLELLDESFEQWIMYTYAPGMF